MYVLFAGKFVAFRKEDRAPMIASFIIGDVSLSNYAAKLMAPDLAANP